MITPEIEEEQANFNLWRLYLSHIFSCLLLEKQQIPSVSKVEKKSAKIMKEDTILYVCCTADRCLVMEAK